MGLPEHDIAALEASGIGLSWGSMQVAQNVSLHVMPREICCLVGRSGCGKTTLLHALAGLTRPTAGRVLVRGEDVTGQPGHVSYMLQKDLLLQHKRVIDNVSLPLVLSGVPKREARETAGALFDRFGLSGTELKWPHELSGGMRQRAALLRTHLMGCDVMLLDEPFSALDAFTRADMRDWFRELVTDLGLAALVITHDVDEAACLANRVYALAGNPNAGRPSTIAGEVSIRRDDATASANDGPFDLSSLYMQAKSEIFAML